MARENMAIDWFRLKLQYLGYDVESFKSINPNQLRQLINFVSVVVNNPNYDPNKMFEDLDYLSLEEVKKKTEQVLHRYFNLHNVLSISEKDVRKIKTLKPSSVSDAYDKINSLLTEVNPIDLDIELTDGSGKLGNFAMAGQIEKPVVLLPGHVDDPRRKVYFSKIILGDKLNLVSVGTLAHEIAHSQQESHIGYTKDILNKEVISIFIEKLVALEMDTTGDLLKRVERCRFNDLLNHWSSLSQRESFMSFEEKVNDLLYIRSTLYANKLFDMYISERKQKHKDGYIDDIQKVFDGKMTVDEMINRRNITLNKSLDLNLIRRHS